MATQRHHYENFLIFPFSFRLDHDKDNLNDDNGVDIEHDDDQPLMGDLDGMDHDPNDMSRPRKIRR